MNPEQRDAIYSNRELVGPSDPPCTVEYSTSNCLERLLNSLNAKNRSAESAGSDELENSLNEVSGLRQSFDTIISFEGNNPELAVLSIKKIISAISTKPVNNIKLLDLLLNNLQPTIFDLLLANMIDPTKDDIQRHLSCEETLLYVYKISRNLKVIIRNVNENTAFAADLLKKTIKLIRQDIS